MKKYLNIIAVLVLLAVSFTAGFYTHRSITFKRFKRIAQLDKPGGLTNHLSRSLELTEEQKSVITPILDKYNKRLHQVNRKFFQELQQNRSPIVDSMFVELKSHLSESQIVILNNRLDNIKRNRYGKKRRRPHQPGSSNK